MSNNLNATAGEWKPSVSAQEWKPSWMANAPAPAPLPVPPGTNSDATPPTVSAADLDLETFDDDEGADDDDEKWLANLKETNPEEYAKVMADMNDMGGDDDVVVDQVVEEVAKVEIKEKEAEKAPAAVPAPEPAVEAASVVEEPPVVMVEGDPREHINVVFIGHVDAGKSTLSGQMLYLTNYVDKRTIERYEKEAKERNRESWFLAYIMDTSEEERAKGKTVEVGRAHFETKSKRFTILDAPGHKNYVPNMISGAAQADCGILVISCRKGEFETGFEKGGQTREHALLAKTLGVKKLVVVLNKMDDPTVGWSKKRYDSCIEKLKPYLRGCGYLVRKDVQFIPISGLKGTNIKDKMPKDICPWYDGQTLLSCLDDLDIPGRNSDANLRIPILDRYFERGCMVMGKVESGTVRVGQTITVMPLSGVTSKVQQIIIGGGGGNGEEGGDINVVSARTGENVKLKLSGLEINDLHKGYVLCNSEQPCKQMKKLKAVMSIVDMPEKRSLFTAGYQAMLHCHTAAEECTVVKLVCEINKKTQEKSKRAPAFVKAGGLVECTLEVEKTMCAETFEDMQHLGRFTLRDEQKTIAIGKILEILS